MTERVVSAGVVVVRRVYAGWRVLLLRVYDYWDCPKGVVQPGEDPLATARREVLEETGIGDLEFRWGEEYIETPPYSKNKVARYYLAETATAEVELPISPELGKPEHHEFRWLDWVEAHKLTVERLRVVLEWARQRLD
jgi:8-oxo-dGTP pyrophosphatase MutT (NUDIX family)